MGVSWSFILSRALEPPQAPHSLVRANAGLEEVLKQNLDFYQASAAYSFNKVAFSNISFCQKVF